MPGGVAGVVPAAAWRRAVRSRRAARTSCSARRSPSRRAATEKLQLMPAPLSSVLGGARRVRERACAWRCAPRPRCSVPSMYWLPPVIGIPLLDPAGRRVVGVDRAADGAGRGVDEAEAGVVLLQVAVAGAVEDPVGGRAAGVLHGRLGAVGLLAGDVGVDLGDAHAAGAGVGDGRHLERAGGGARAADGGLADGREGGVRRRCRWRPTRRGR